MNSKIQKLTALIFCVILTSLAAGCFKKDTASLNEEQIDQQIAIAQQYLNEGQTEAAFTILEDLIEAFPENPNVVEGLAFAYASQNENEVAATYFERLYTIDPSRSEVCLYAAQIYAEQENWEAAVHNYENYLEDFSDDAASWKDLSEIQLKLNQPRLALQALLKSTEASEGALDLEDQSKIGHLFLQLGGTKQAQERFELVLEHDEANPQALLGLLQIDLQSDDFQKAVTLLDKLDSAHPGMLDNSPLAPAREVIAHWKEEQSSKQKQLEEEQQKAAVALAAASAQEELEQAVQAATLAQSDAPKTEVSNKKVGRIIPNTPIQNVSENYGVLLTSNGAVLTKTPQVPTPHIIQGTEEKTQKGPQITIGTEKSIEKPVAVAPKPTVKTAEEWLSTAHAYHNQKNYTKAMQSYWKALELKPSDAQAWHKLALASIEAGNFDQAETTALEAIRRKPEYLPYTLAYLKAIQHSRSGEQLMVELAKAKEKFPNSSEISLALARGYDQIEGNTYNARMAYLEFLETFPNHPRTGEVRAALRRLR